MSTISPHIPYCGGAPIPGTASWNLDPGLLLVLTAAAAAHLWSISHRTRGQLAVGAGGWALLSLLLISPLCNLSVALFSARVTQHMGLILGAAPLLAWSLPKWVRASVSGTPNALASALTFAAVLWLWHLPRLYDATFANDGLYWLMDVSLFSAALWFWVSLMQGSAAYPLSLAAGLFTGLQMSLLGALLSFAPRALFAVHLSTTAPWGLTPLEDQQIGGTIMWVPGGLLLVAVLGTVLHRLLGPQESPLLGQDGLR